MTTRTICGSNCKCHKHTDTPRTDAMYQVYTSEYQRRLLSEDLERKLAAEIANREKCCRDGNQISDELFDTQLKLKKAEAEIEFWKAKAYEAEESEGKHEAEVEELQQQKKNCMEIIDDDAEAINELKAEVERLKESLKAWTTLD